MADTPAVMDVTWWLALCVDCSGSPLPQPFSDPDERNRWATEHSDFTGHRVMVQKTAKRIPVEIKDYSVRAPADEDPARFPIGKFISDMVREVRTAHPDAVGLRIGDFRMNPDGSATVTVTGMEPVVKDEGGENHG